MNLDFLLKQTCEWLKGAGPNSDIVISSRVRLARNLEEFPFSHWSNKKREKDVMEILCDATGGTDILKK